MTKPLVLEERSTTRWLAAGLTLISVALIGYIFSLSPRSLIEDGPTFLTVLGGVWAFAIGLFFVLGIFLLRLQQTVVLTDEGFGIIRNGEQRIIPFSSILHAQILKLEVDYLFFLQNTRYQILYQEGTEKRTTFIYDIHIFDRTLLYKNFDLFTATLHHRFQKAKEDIEKPLGSSFQQILETWRSPTWWRDIGAQFLSTAKLLGTALLIACFVGFLLYINESGKMLVSSYKLQAKKIIHKNFFYYDSDYFVGRFEVDGKEIESHISWNEPKPDDIFLIEKWRGRIWGNCYRVKKNLTDEERKMEEWRKRLNFNTKATK